MNNYKPLTIGQALFDRWRGYLCTLGIVDAAYQPKPAWHVFVDYLP